MKVFLAGRFNAESAKSTETFVFFERDNYRPLGIVLLSAAVLVLVAGWCPLFCGLVLLWRLVTPLLLFIVIRSRQEHRAFTDTFSSPYGIALASTDPCLFSVG